MITVQPGSSARFMLTSVATTDTERRGLVGDALAAEVIAGDLTVNATATVLASPEADSASVVDLATATATVARVIAASSAGIQFPAFLQQESSSPQSGQEIRIRDRTSLDLQFSGDPRVSLSASDEVLTFTPQAGEDSVPVGSLSIQGFTGSVRVGGAPAIDLSPLAIRTDAEIIGRNTGQPDASFMINGEIEIGLDDNNFVPLLSLIHI